MSYLPHIIKSISNPCGYLAFSSPSAPQGLLYLLAAKLKGKKKGERTSAAARLIIISDIFMCRVIQELIDCFSLLLIQI